MWDSSGYVGEDESVMGLVSVLVLSEDVDYVGEMTVVSVVGFENDLTV